MHARPFLKPAASMLSVTNEDVHETERDPAAHSHSFNALTGR
jgi:hypothetical protein